MFWRSGYPTPTVLVVPSIQRGTKLHDSTDPLPSFGAEEWVKQLQEPSNVEAPAPSTKTKLEVAT